MWERPDFFELDGKQILMLGPMEMRPKGEFHNGHSVIAFIGSYDRDTHIFTQESVQLVDSGIDFYTTQTTLAPDGRRIMTVWIYTPQSADGITFAAEGKATVTVEQFELNL